MSKQKLWFSVLMVPLCFLIWACSDDSDSSEDRSVSPVIECASLANMVIPETAIGLETSGATITSAILVAASEEVVGDTSVTHALPEYCEVLGSILPVDPNAPNIEFQVNIPTKWNQKTIQVGGGGLNGKIPDNLALHNESGSPTSAAFPPDAEYPISRGYAMFGSDSGHQDTSNTATWALNDEAWLNFAHAGLKKTHDAVYYIIEQLYGAEPATSYFMGISQGGREAMEVAQRYPEDYDGIVASVPIMGYTAHVVHKAVLATQQTGDAWIEPGKYSVVADEVMSQCDGLDGLVDGVISNYPACEEQFNPDLNADPYANIRCAVGATDTTACLLDSEIDIIYQMHDPLVFDEPLANNWQSFNGYGVGREDGGWLTVNPQPNYVDQPSLSQPGATLSYGILKDPDYILTNFTISEFIEELTTASEMIDSTNTDLSAFFARGGKMIIKTSASDYYSNPHTVMSYYDRLLQRFGTQEVDDHVRLYVLPNGSHSGTGISRITGDRIPQYVDLIEMSTNWVEKNVTPPDAPVLKNMEKLPPYTVNASKPICRYPLYPKYVGDDPTDSASFECVAD